MNKKHKDYFFFRRAKQDSFSQLPEIRASFSDIIAIVRRSIWSNKYFSKSENQVDLDKYSEEKIDALIYQLTLAA